MDKDRFALVGELIIAINFLEMLATNISSNSQRKIAHKMSKNTFRTTQIFLT